MVFKYSAISGTVKRLGYDILENPRAVLEAIKAAGYDAVDLPGDPDKIERKVLRRLIDSIGLEVAEVQGAWAFHHAGESRDLASDDKETRQRGIRYGKSCVDLAADLGAQYVEICSSQTPVPQIPFPKLSLHTLRSNFLASTREICEYAADHNICILFEPLNRYEAYPGVMTSVFDAINLIDELGLPNLGVQPDIYHMNIAEASITDALRAAGHRIKLMHMRETNDYFLGEGHADHHAIMRVLKEINFEGHISIYMPLVPRELSYRAQSDEAVRRPDLFTVLEKQLLFLKGIEGSLESRRAVYSAEAPYLSKKEIEETAGGEEIY